MSKFQKEETLSIIKAYYLGNLTLSLTFSNGVQKRLNFSPLFRKHLKGYYKQFLQPPFFKTFIVANGNVSWGENEDVIFPVSFLYNQQKALTEKDEVLYVL